MASEPPRSKASPSRASANTTRPFKAQIETGGFYTGYQFEIDTNSSYDFTRCACPSRSRALRSAWRSSTGNRCRLVWSSLNQSTSRGAPASSPSASDLASIGATLQPGTTYHYRVTVSNGAHGAPGPGPNIYNPFHGSHRNRAVDRQRVGVERHVNRRDAGSQINLHEASAGAYYQFQLVKEPSEYASEILCPAKLPPATDGCAGTQSASALPIGFLPGNTAQPGVDLSAILDLASAGVTLKPGTTYHYRVLVARRVQTEDTIQWEAPTVYGADQTFTTPTPPSIESESISHLTRLTRPRSADRHRGPGNDVQISADSSSLSARDGTTRVQGDDPESATTEREAARLVCQSERQPRPEQRRRDSVPRHGI